MTEQQQTGRKPYNRTGKYTAANRLAAAEARLAAAKAVARRAAGTVRRLSERVDRLRGAAERAAGRAARAAAKAEQPEQPAQAGKPSGNLASLHLWKLAERLACEAAVSCSVEERSALLAELAKVQEAARRLS